MCFYFVFTVFSTVGFGDIFAVNTPERVIAAEKFLGLVEVAHERT
jgi:hypothetical protein